MDLEVIRMVVLLIPKVILVRTDHRLRRSCITVSNKIQCAHDDGSALFTHVDNVE